MVQIWVVSASKINTSVERSASQSLAAGAYDAVGCLCASRSPLTLILMCGLQMAQSCCSGSQQGCSTPHLHRINYFTRHLGVQAQRKQICISGQLYTSIGLLGT